MVVDGLWTYSIFILIGLSILFWLVVITLIASSKKGKLKKWLIIGAFISLIIFLIEVAYELYLLFIFNHTCSGEECFGGLISMIIFTPYGLFALLPPVIVFIVCVVIGLIKNRQK